MDAGTEHLEREKSSGGDASGFPAPNCKPPPPPLMACGWPSCKTAGILQVCPPLPKALRFNNVCYRNVVDFSCKFSCISQVCRRFLGPPGCSGPSPGDLTHCRCWWWRLLPTVCGRSWPVEQAAPGDSSPLSPSGRVWAVLRPLSAVSGWCGRRWRVWLVVCGVSWLCLSLSCVILYDTLYNRARNKRARTRRGGETCIKHFPASLRYAGGVFGGGGVFVIAANI